jgi:N-acetylglutamate synthase-like GNAT family acetyltransferase
MEVENNIEIIAYQTKYAKVFYDLNIEWLKTYFYVEPYDEEVLSKPEHYIIGKGGYIFFARINNDIVGTAALMPIGNKGLFELTKMAVLPQKRGLKIGQYLLQYCIDNAKNMGLPNLILYSNTRLKNAIYIYRKYGFIEVPIEKNSPYLRSDIKMKLEF